MPTPIDPVKINTPAKNRKRCLLQRVRMVFQTILRKKCTTIAAAKAKKAPIAARIEDIKYPPEPGSIYA